MSKQLIQCIFIVSYQLVSLSFKTDRLQPTNSFLTCNLGNTGLDNNSWIRKRLYIFSLLPTGNPALGFLGIAFPVKAFKNPANKGCYWLIFLWWIGVLWLKSWSALGLPDLTLGCPMTMRKLVRHSKCYIGFLFMGAFSYLYWKARWTESFMLLKAAQPNCCTWQLIGGSSLHMGSLNKTGNTECTRSRLHISFIKEQVWRRGCCGVAGGYRHLFAAHCSFPSSPDANNVVCFLDRWVLLQIILYLQESGKILIYRYLLISCCSLYVIFF